MTVFCICGEPMEYIIPSDEMAPPILKCHRCSRVIVACGNDPVYTSDHLHEFALTTYPIQHVEVQQMIHMSKRDRMDLAGRLMKRGAL